MITPSELVATMNTHDGSGVSVKLFTNTEDTAFSVDFDQEGSISSTKVFTDIDQAADYFNELARGEIKGYMGKE